MYIIDVIFDLQSYWKLISDEKLTWEGTIVPAAITCLMVLSQE
jgi:hypothetical protein